MPSRFWNWRRAVRMTLAASALAIAGIAAMVVPPWISALWPYSLTRHLAADLVVGIEVMFGVALAAGLAGTAYLGTVVIQARRKRNRRPIVASGLLFCCASLIGLGIAEVVATVCGAPPRSLPAPPARDPELPHEFAENDDREVTLVVLGESSAAGVPFERRMSVGEIVTWQLRELVPARRFRALVLARLGDTLEGQYCHLSELRRRPDVVVVYCGHNELSARVPWSRRVDFYRDQVPNFLEKTDQFARRISSLYGLIRRASDKYRIELPPTTAFKPKLVDAPTYTRSEYAASVTDFRRRLDAIASFCDSVRALLILVVPPGNDAGFEPTRSFLPAMTSAAERASFARDFLLVRALESSKPRQALAEYRALLTRQPGFAETHYRLAKLLETTGDWDEAYQHYIAARDLDGMPLRCLSAFQQAYREVAAEHHCVLVDGQALFHAIGPHGLLDDTLFIDVMHPSLRGHLALAMAILDELRAQGRFGWPPGMATPTIDPALCAAHFGLDFTDWKGVCGTGEAFYHMAAILRYDPKQCRSKERAYAQARRQIEAGEPPELVGLPNVGIPKAINLGLRF